MIKLTDNEIKILASVANYEFPWFDEGIESGSCIPTIEFAYCIAHELEGNVHVGGALLSSLQNKGIFQVEYYEDCSYAILTELGSETLKEIKKGL